MTVSFNEQRTDAIFAELNQCHLPGAAVGIAVRGYPVYRKGFGLASAELPVVLSATTRMRLFSVSKHFACLAYLLLCEEGQASIDDPIDKYLPELHPVARAVTPRQLMGNISGLRDSHDITWVFSGAAAPVLSTDLLSFYHTIDDVNCAPGTSWIYNNGGFLLLTFIVERITGQSMEEVLYRRIFGPVGMHDTLLRRTNTDFIPNSATMHMTNPAGSYHRSYLGGERAGEGGVVSTVDDMLRWLRHMDDPVVGNVDTWTAMKTPQVLANGTSTGYGLGLFAGKYRGVETVFHSGGGMGANAFMLKVPAARLDVVVLVNRHDVDSMSLAHRILDACLPDLDPVKDSPRRKTVAGVFRSPTTGRVVQLFSKDEQQRGWIDNYDIPLEIDGDGVLRPSQMFGFLKQQLTPLDSLGPERIRFDDFGNSDVLLRVVSESRIMPDAVLGRYRSESTGTEAEIYASETGACLRTVGRFGCKTFDLECLARGTWHARSQLPWMGGIVSFDDDCRAFRFTTARTWALPFRRVA